MLNSVCEAEMRTKIYLSYSHIVHLSRSFLGPQYFPSCLFTHLCNPPAVFSSFNPVAPTSMMKVLSRIATAEVSKVTVNEQFVDSFQHLLAHFHVCFYLAGFVFQSTGRISVPDKAALEQLCSGSSGDIRSAVNSLQFSCFTGGFSRRFYHKSEVLLLS